MNSMRSDLANDIAQLTGEHLVLVGAAMLFAIGVGAAALSDLNEIATFLG